MKIVRRIGSITIIFALLFSLFVGCNKTDSSSPISSEGSPSSSATEPTSGMPEVGDFTEKIAMIWYICSDASAYKDDNFVAKELNERFNVEMDTIRINGFDNDKMNVTLASGDIPDVFIRWGGDGYYRDGIIQSVEKADIEKYMPQTYKALEEYGAGAWAPVISPIDGKLTGIPQFTINGNMVGTMSIRQDWLDALGATIPTTVDEMTEVLRKFTFEDPDGNGVDDTYGTSIPGLHNQVLFASLPTIFGAYNVQPTYWTLDETGRVAPGVIHTGYKEALKQMHAWYQEGLIDPEWVTDDNAVFSNKLTSGRIGLWDTCNPTYLNANSLTGIPSLTAASNPNASWTYLEPIAGPEGHANGVSTGPAGSWTMMYSAKASPQLVARAMQMAEATNTDTSLYELTYFGIEGESMQRNEDGSLSYMEGVVPMEFGANAFRTGTTLSWDFVELSFPKNVSNLMRTSTEYPFLRNIISTGQLSSTYAEEDVDTAEMSKLTLEFFFSAITGDIDIDEQWDAYIQRWLDLGGQAQLDGAATLPIIFENK